MMNRLTMLPLLAVATLAACSGGTGSSYGTAHGYSGGSAYATPPTYLGKPTAIDRFWDAVETGKAERKQQQILDAVNQTNTLIAKQNKLLRRKQM